MPEPIFFVQVQPHRGDAIRPYRITIGPKDRHPGYLVHRVLGWWPVDNDRLPGVNTHVVGYAWTAKGGGWSAKRALWWARRSLAAHRWVDARKRARADKRKTRTYEG